MTVCAKHVKVHFNMLCSENAHENVSKRVKNEWNEFT